MIAINKNAVFEFAEQTLPVFQPGDLVVHRRYGYRGVVVAADEHCKADPEWYLSNKTQPDRNQPWYHVLVHGLESCTYAAQSSLMADTSGAEVRHPFVKYFFEEFREGRYVRNNHEWPDSV